MPLLVRRPVAPTRAGARLLEHAGSLLLRLDAARADLARMAVDPGQELTLAASPLALPARSLAALPASGVTLHVLPREAIPAAVATGAVDLGLVDGLAAPSDPLRLPDVAPLTATGVAEEPLAVLLPVRHPLARRRGLRLGDLADARWLDAPAAGIPLDQLRAAAHGAPPARGFRPALRYEGTDVRTLLALVAAGHGLTLLPLSVARSADGTAPVPLTEPRLVHRIELLHGGMPDGSDAHAPAAAARPAPAPGGPARTVVQALLGLKSAAEGEVGTLETRTHT
ncbi:LysR substrate-binding domain-containing protein [Streptomyces sp. NPDC059909]|uniref:LysR substrate-binding domain-containing protein n=1 Tax=Streptomyces sp. NPDC059909 TaxID=3346998 RepID=UPI003658D8ED